jgi:Fe-S cluster biogenesis protein NfuA
MDHFTSGLPAIDEDGSATAISTQVDSAVVTQIKKLLDSHVRPSVAQDGGDIVYQNFENGVVYLKMQGACSGCPSSTATLKMGIENLLRHYLPEVTEVRAVA